MPLTLLAVHAHPDDETITTGGVLARYAAEGIQTVVVTCTGGEEGEISDPALATRENLAVVRAKELEEALRILGVHRHVMLGYRDSGMMGTPQNDHPDSFWRTDLDGPIGKLVRVVRETRADVIVAYNENGGYGHPDHINAHRIAVAAFDAAGDPAAYPGEGGAPWTPRKLYYSAWPRSQFVRMRRLLAEAGIPDPFAEEEAAAETELGTPDEVVTTEVDIAAFVDKKRAALAAHRTQMAADGFFMQMPESIWRQVWVKESFQRIESRVPAPRQEDDLFAGLRT